MADIVQQYLDLLDSQREVTFAALEGLTDAQIWQHPAPKEWSSGVYNLHMPSLQDCLNAWLSGKTEPPVTKLIGIWLLECSAQLLPCCAPRLPHCERQSRPPRRQHCVHRV